MATIDRAQSTTRVAADVDELTGSNYTLVPDAIRRYAYTDVYRNTLDYFAAQFEALGFEISYDPVGTFVARNRPVGEPVFGIGSHCDSNRNGGPYDGTLGVVVALEICRLNGGARNRSAAPGDLVSRGGGISVRADAAREPHHGAAR